MRHELDSSFEAHIRLDSGDLSECLGMPPILLLSHHGTGSPDIDNDGLSIQLPQAPISCVLFREPQFHGSCFFRQSLFFPRQGRLSETRLWPLTSVLTAFSCRHETLCNIVRELISLQTILRGWSSLSCPCQGNYGVFCGLSTEATSQCKHVGKPKHGEVTAPVRHP
jgi:hypothetical protein